MAFLAWLGDRGAGRLISPSCDYFCKNRRRRFRMLSTPRAGLVELKPMPARLLYVVTEDWYFLSHRLPMARAAKAAGYDVHVATRIKSGKAEIEREGFTVHPLQWRRGSLSPIGSFTGILELR